MTDNIGRVGNAEDAAHRAAIAEVLATHSRGIDRNDPAILKTAYWPGAEVDYGSFKGPAHDFADLVGHALQGAYELTQHLLGQTFYSIQGDKAATESYVYARHLLHGAEEELNFAGRYLDQLELREGQWKIAHRQVVMDWCRRAAVVDEREGEAFGALSKGVNDASDLSFVLFAKD
jgi:hypothetical protein